MGVGYEAEKFRRDCAGSKDWIGFDSRVLSSSAWTWESEEGNSPLDSRRWEISRRVAPVLKAQCSCSVVLLIESSIEYGAGQDE